VTSSGWNCRCRGTASSTTFFPFVDSFFSNSVSRQLLKVLQFRLDWRLPLWRRIVKRPEKKLTVVCFQTKRRYLCKVLPHLGRLVFCEEPSTTNPKTGRLSAGGRKRYRVSGIASVTGEVMTFYKALVYEGPMSLWLPQLLMAIQATLQVRACCVRFWAIPFAHFAEALVSSSRHLRTFLLSLLRVFYLRDGCGAFLWKWNS